MSLNHDTDKFVTQIIEAARVRGDKPVTVANIRAILTQIAEGRLVVECSPPGYPTADAVYVAALMLQAARGPERLPQGRGWDASSDLART